MYFKMLIVFALLEMRARPFHGNCVTQAFPGRQISSQHLGLPPLELSGD